MCYINKPISILNINIILIKWEVHKVLYANTKGSLLLTNEGLIEIWNTPTPTLGRSTTTRFQNRTMREYKVIFSIIICLVKNLYLYYNVKPKLFLLLVDLIILCHIIF